MPPKQKSREWVQNLVTKAFIIEAITDKQGCTTRWQDLPGKPLHDFIFAGINSASSLALLADEPHPVFKHNPEALRLANWQKSQKFINFGLLEILFPTVAARLEDDNPSTVIDTMLGVLKGTTNKDVQSILECREIAWSTSALAHKSSFEPSRYKHLESVWHFYMQMIQDFDNKSSNYHWSKQFDLGLPMVRAFFNEYQSQDEYIDTTKAIFDQQRLLFPDVAVGIIADMCAAALFLHLSFTDI